MNKALAHVLKQVAIGVVSGILYYVIYLVLLPKLLLAGIPGVQGLEDLSSPGMIIYLYLLIALGTAESILKRHPVSIPIRALTKIIPAMILLTVLNNGVLTGSLDIGGEEIGYRFDISILLYTIILLSLIYGFIDAFTYFRERAR